MAESCTHDGLRKALSFGIDQACEYAQGKGCQELMDNLNFLEVYYCRTNGNIYVLVPFAIFFIILVFNFLKTSAEDYLTPALSALSKKLVCSESLAGVTLLALANGSPDVLGSIAAGGKDARQGIGPLFGGGLFVTCVVLYRCVASCPHGVIEVQPNTISRDILFYISAIATLIVFGSLFKEINFYHALAFAGLYVLYVVVVTIQEFRMRVEKTDEARKDALMQLEEESGKSMEDLHHQHEIEAIDAHGNTELPQGVQSVSRIVSGTDLKESLQPLHFRLSTSRLSGGVVDTQVVQGVRKANMFSAIKRFGFRVRSFWALKHGEWLEMSFFEKVLTILDIPFNFLRDITIPQADEENYNKYYAMLSCFGAPLIIVTFLDDDNASRFERLYFIAPVSILCALIISKTSHVREMPKYQFVYAIIGMVVSVIWIWYVANLLLDLIKMLQVITGIDMTFMLITILAWGNSAGDLFTNPSLSRRGYGMMAVTGCYAGQMFNLLVGFGAVLLKNTWGSRNEGGTINFDIFTSDNEIAVLCIGALFLVLVFSLIYLRIGDWIVNKVQGYILLLAYLVVFGTALGLSIHKKVRT